MTILYNNKENIKKIKDFPVGTPFSRYFKTEDKLRFGWITGYSSNTHSELVFVVKWADSNCDESKLHPSNVHPVDFY